MNTRKNIVDLEAFRDMLHISPRVLGQSFAELPFEEEILDFLWFLGHSAQIKTLSDVNINKFFQPWRSFAAVINKCLTGKSFGFDNFRYHHYSAILKRRREEDDDQEGPSTGSDRGSKRRREGGEHASASTLSKLATGKEPVQTTGQMEEPSHLVFETGAEDQPIVQTSRHPEWFSQPRRPPTLDRDRNKTLPAA
nr:hypothetical protein [Tanacetum cinerariifolium]